MILAIISVVITDAQRISYAYDADGNRIKRELVIPRTVNAGGRASENIESYYDPMGEHTVKFEATANGKINISVINFSEQDNGTIDVYSVNGMVLLSSDISDTLTVIDISSQPHGVYILRVTVNGEQTTWKITKN